MEEIQKMTLKGYYDGLGKISPRATFIRRVASKCNVTESTVRNWVLHGMTPQRYTYIKVLEEETGIKEENLW